MTAGGKTPIIPHMKKLLVPISLLTLAASFVVVAQTHLVEIKIGFCTGKDYRTFTEYEKAAYAAGFVNGLTMAPALDAPKDKTKWLEDYFVGMTQPQVAAIIAKYLDDNPGIWHRSLNMLSYAAIKTAYDKAHPGLK